MIAQRTENSSRVWPPRWLPLIAILVVAVAWPIAGWYAQKALVKSRNRIEDWLPATFPETKALYHFADRFGSDEFLMISWEGCTFGDPRAVAVADLLTSPNPDGKRFIEKATTADAAMASLKELNTAQAKGSLQGIFIGPDGVQTCIIATLSETGMQDRRAVLAWTWESALKGTGLGREQVHIAGTSADSVAVDEASSENLVLLNCLSYVVCFTILSFSLRKFWLVGTLFLCSIFNQHIALAFIYLSGGHVDSVQLLVANLCFVLTISSGLHFLGYYREAEKTDTKSPALRALRESCIPSMLAALTTSLGFFSLCTSELVPIRAFGFYSGLLVPINTVIVITLLSIHGKWTSARSWSGRLLSPAEITRPQANIGNAIAKGVVSWVRRFPLALIGGWLVIMLVLSYGVTKLTTSVGTQKLLSPQSKLVRDYAWLESRIGPLVPVEFVLTYNSDSIKVNTDYTNRLLALDQLRDRVVTIPEIESTLSVLNFVPNIPSEKGTKYAARRGAIAKKISEAKGRFQESRYLYEDANEQSWRLSGRVAGSKSVEYSQLLQKLQVEVDEFLKQDTTGAVKVEVGGGVPFVYRMQRQLLEDLLSSFTSAFISIAISMAILFRSISGGVLTMIPNVTPAGIVFGLMGWLGMEIEIGTVLTASVMMGVCVDDTLHFVSHFRALRRAGKTPQEAVDEALENCGGAMIQTAVVCGVGMLVFYFSSFVPVARFAWLTFSLLMVGLVSDLVLTPAMLLSPLHHLFYWEKRKKNTGGVASVTTDEVQNGN